MTDPYRDQNLRCPACAATLREFRTRQVCDACQGIFLSIADLTGAIHDLTSITATLEFSEERAGTRPCPTCATQMTRCKLRIILEDDIEKPRPELDRCVDHGVWFDDQELARVFERVTGKGYGGGVGRKYVAGSTRGIDLDQGGWSAMFKGFGRWGGGT